MPPILNAQGISKSFGATPLLRKVAFTISEGQRIGLIGPNGSGKSTLLRILAGEIEPDSGEVTLRRHTRMSYVAQESQFPAGATVWSAMEGAARASSVPEPEWPGSIRETLGRAGFLDFGANAAKLSGGWRKRLAIALGLVGRPDVLLLDEPTNHLDLDGIEWLENLLQEASFASVIVSHDRYVLENVATHMVELNRAYPDGVLRAEGGYSALLAKKEEFLESQVKRQDALENRVKTEIEWLRRGPKARATKAKARINRAHELIGELAQVSSRNRTTSASISFSATGRQTKRLLNLQGLSYGFGGRQLFSSLNLPINAGMRVGLVGPNGSGKTTLLKLLVGEIEPEEGQIERASTLRTVYFDQNRELDLKLTLRRALAPDSDSVLYQDRVVHVASWAARFLFSGDQLNQPLQMLSGGERARVAIARLMLQPADVLLLDEPTNDLDIATLEVLEESLLEFRGCLVLVTHDRYMLDRVTNVVLGLDGEGRIETFADYLQWERWKQEQADAPMKRSAAIDQPSAARTKKLSYLEAREFAGMEDCIEKAELSLRENQDRLEDPLVATDAVKLQEALRTTAEAQDAVDTLYARWAQLTEKTGVV